MKVYLSENIAPGAYARLAEKFEIVDTFDHPEELDAIIVRRARVSRDVIKRASRLKVISMHGVGRDSIDMEAAAEYGIPVPNVPSEGSRSVAELSVTLMLALNRKVKMIDTGLREGRFTQFGDNRFLSHEVFNKTLGLVGTGNIAKGVAAIMHGGFDMKVLCYNPRRSAEECLEWGFKKVDTLQELFSCSDFISVNILLTRDTTNMIDASVFQAANPELVLVNTSRGGIVNEADLYDALTSGKIRAAALDVFEQEPPDKDHPLLSLENFIGTFHVGGSTVESLDRVSNKAVDHVFEYTRI